MTLSDNINVSDSMDNFNTPVRNAPLPRWQRKAMESNSSTTRTLSATDNFARAPIRTKKSKTPSRDCRFIPNRSAMDLELCSALLDEHKENSFGGSSSEDTSAYSSMLTSSLFDNVTKLPNASNTDLPGSKILSFASKAPAPKEGYVNPNRVLYSQNECGPGVRRNKFRHIPQKPEKILDAPNLLEDFYLNLVDWGSNNILSVALAEAVYLWNADTGGIERLNEGAPEDTVVTSVAWIPDGTHLAVGTSNHDVQLWDVERMTCVRKLRSHRGRVGALAWNGAVLSSGSRDGDIHNHDVRIADHHIATLAHHTQEVCGLKWSPNGTQLASGGNDNVVCVWDDQSSTGTSTGGRVPRWTPKYTFDHHTAAVKALAWCPWQNNLLATGGGTADRHLRFWNTASGACVNSIDTKSQVCSIVWSPNDKELLTSHGYSQNQLTVWKYPTLARMAELKGHTQRVLHTALSPDGQTVVSGAADETLRFWKVFADNDSSKGRRGPLGEKGPLSARAPSVIR